MNEISLIYDFLIKLFDKDVLVNTISLSKTNEMDFNKENIYPLVNLDLRETQVLNDAVTCFFRITIIQQRDITPIVEDTKLMTNTNLTHNLNETHSIGQRVVNVLNRQNNIENVEVESYTNFTILRNYGMNGVDGVQFDLSLFVENLGSSC